MRSKRPDVMTWRPALCIKGAKQPPHRRPPRPGADTLRSAFSVGYSVRRLSLSLPIGKLSLWPATLLGRPSVPVRALHAQWHGAAPGHFESLIITQSLAAIQRAVTKFRPIRSGVLDSAASNL